MFVFFFSSRRRHTRSLCDWSSDVCSSDLAGAVVDMAGTEKDKEDDPGDKAYEGSEKIGPKAKCSRGFSHQQMPKEKMLLSGEKFWMGGAGTGGGYGDGDRGSGIGGDQREGAIYAGGSIAGSAGGDGWARGGAV